MLICVKTTVEIADALLLEAKKTAMREGTTVRALIEAGLRRVLRERRSGRFRLRRATCTGQGLNPALAEADWDRLRALAYEGRGA